MQINMGGQMAKITINGGRESMQELTYGVMMALLGGEKQMGHM